MLTPSEPVAEEFFIEKRTDLRDWSEIELSEKAQAPTLGSYKEAEGLPPVPDLSRDSRTYPHKVLVQLGGGGLRRDSYGPPAVNYLPYVTIDGGRTLPPNPAGDIVPHVSPDGRLDLFVKGFAKRLADGLGRSEPNGVRGDR